MADNSQAIAQALAEAEQHVAQLRAQLAAANTKGGPAAAPGARPGHMQRMADSMGKRAAQGQAFVDNDRFMQGGQRDAIQRQLRLRMQQLANPGASPMQLDMQRRAAPGVTPARANAWQNAQPGQDDWNNPWKYTDG